MVTAKIANMGAGSRTDLPTASLQEVSRNQAARKLNVSERSVKTAKKVEQNATPELSNPPMNGKLFFRAALLGWILIRY